MTSSPYKLLLVGGGHAHVVALRSWARARKDREIGSTSTATPPPPRLALVSDRPSSVYSGMVPGVIEGIYSPEEAVVPLGPLCDAAGFELVVGVVKSVSSARGEVEVDVSSDSPSSSSSKTLRYETLSVDVGSGTAPVEGADFEDKGKAEALVALRPVSSLLERAKPLLVACDDSTFRRPPSVVVVGGGAAGVEVAAAVAARIERNENGKRRERRRPFVSLVSGPRGLLPDEGDERAPLLAARELERAGVELYDRARVVSCSSSPPSGTGSGGAVVEVEGGGERKRIDADFVLFATGSAPHRWLRDKTDLPLDERGFIKVNENLRCRFEEGELRERPVFASGDCARVVLGDDDSPSSSSPPKAGVYAVRAGRDVLYPNLRAAAFAGETSEPASWSPSREGRTALALLSVGGKRALALWPWRRRTFFLPSASSGAWVWWLKDLIDRRWIRGR